MARVALPLLSLLPSQAVCPSPVTNRELRLGQGMTRTMPRTKADDLVLVPSDVVDAMEALHALRRDDDLSASAWRTLVPRKLMDVAERHGAKDDDVKRLVELIHHRTAVARGSPAIAEALAADSAARATVRSTGCEAWSKLQRVPLGDSLPSAPVAGVAKWATDACPRWGTQLGPRMAFSDPSAVLAAIPAGLHEVLVRHSKHLVIAGGFASSACLPHLSPVENQDIDMFVWGVSPQQASVIADDVGRAIAEIPATSCKCFRTGNAVTWTAYFRDDAVDVGVRTFQLVARLYATPEEMLYGFDVQAAAVCLRLVAGGRVEAWGTASFFAAVAANAVWVDPERQSATYALRLLKYYARGWEVFLFGFDRKAHMIFPPAERGGHSFGLAELMLYETQLFHHMDRREIGEWEHIRRMRKSLSFPEGDRSDYHTIIPGEVLERREFRRRARYDVSDVEGTFRPGDIAWKTRDPGSQVTGSFNPVKTPYYTGSITPPYAA